MLRKVPILCFAHDWGGDPTSKTHIMRILARTCRVLWVNSIGMRRPSISGADLRRIGVKLRRSLAGCREEEPNVLVANPLTIPLPGVSIADRLNAAILAGRLRQLCRQHGLHRPILWTFLPTIGQLLERLGERLVIYHCVDEYSAFTGVSRESLLRMERDLARRADLVLVSSEGLLHERRALNPNTYFISHGVDVEHFARALDPGTALPEDLRGLARPVIGFFGLLADWVDFEMVAEMAFRRPEWSFVLVGKASADLRILRGFRNIHLLGQKPYAALPAYCRGFDVGIIPFRVNALTLRANPLKLREYLAAGLPVVSSPLPEAARYEGLIHLAEGPDAFLAAVESALSERSETMVRRRLEAMSTEGWERRVAEISALIERKLGVAA